MPRNTREWAHRKIEESRNNITWAGKHLWDISEVYKNQHPEIAADLNAILETFLAMDEILNKLRQSF